MNTRKLSNVLALLAIFSLLITQCSPAAPTAAPTEPPVQATEPAAEATEPPAEATAPAEGGDYTQAPREETVIFDIDGGRVANPENWNPYVPTGRRDHGFHQEVQRNRQEQRQDNDEDRDAAEGVLDGGTHDISLNRRGGSATTGRRTTPGSRPP